MEFIVNEPVRFASGRFSLTPEQSKSRRHALKEVASGVFEPTAEIMFKAGERVQILSPLPKAMATRLSPTRENAKVEVETTAEDTRRRRRA